MTKPISSSGPSCFSPSLAELESTATTLSKIELDVEAKLESSIVNTGKVAALCLGGERLTTAACIVAVAQDLEGLFALKRASNAYAEATAAYERALAEHLSCLSEFSDTE